MNSQLADRSRSNYVARLVDILSALALIAACGTYMWRSTAAKPAAAAASTPVPKEALAIRKADTLGSPSARVALVVYSDFQCPYCGRFAREAMPAIQKDFIDTGKVRVAFKHFPLERIHPFAKPAAIAAECASQAGQFWAMHDALFSDQSHLETAALESRAQRIGLDVSKFRACVGGSGAKIVDEDAAEALRLGLNGTPTLYVGTITSSGDVQVTKVVSGGTQESLKALLTEEVQKAS